MMFNTMYYNNYMVVSRIEGGPDNPSIIGFVIFNDVPGGTDVCVNVIGLPQYKPGNSKTDPIGPFGFHIHEFSSCSVNNGAKQFQKAGGHWNPYDQLHGNHAGDFPVLFSNNGVARMCFFTDKFKPTDVIGKTVIIHENPDDYRSQPAGDAGKRIACGVIEIMPQNP